MALKAKNPIEAYQESRQAVEATERGEKIDDLPNKDWLRQT